MFLYTYSTYVHIHLSQCNFFGSVHHFPTIGKTMKRGHLRLAECRQVNLVLKTPSLARVEATMSQSNNWGGKQTQQVLGHLIEWQTGSLCYILHPFYFADQASGIYPSGHRFGIVLGTRKMMWIFLAKRHVLSLLNGTHMSNKETWFGLSRWVSVWSRGSSDEYMEGLMASRVLGESWVRLGKCMNMFPIKFVFKSIKNAGILIPDQSCSLDPQELGIQSLGMMPRAFFRCLEGGLQTQRQLPSQPKNRTYTTAKCRFCKSNPQSDSNSG